jgi:NitT/TauT family transport system substrate-binding protein
VALMKGQGIVDSGEGVASGIGAMSQLRTQDFCMQMVKAGLYKPGEVDMVKVAALQFFNKRVGQDLKAQLTTRH